MDNTFEIKFSNNYDLSLYKNPKFAKYFNLYNKETKRIVNEIDNKYKDNYFVVPSVFYETAWGWEKVFLPFTSVLFKVLSTNKANTSLQFHPLKSEQYIALNNNTKVFDGTTIYEMKKNNFMRVPRNTLHQQKRGSLVLEEQDNVLFDNQETIRIFDDLNRKINNKKDYYKYLLPQYKNKILFSKKYSSFNKENVDRFAFIIDGYLIINVNGEEIKLDKEKELYFIGKKVLIKKIVGYVYVTKCKYYKLQ